MAIWHYADEKLSINVQPIIRNFILFFNFRESEEVFLNDT